MGNSFITAQSHIMNIGNWKVTEAGIEWAGDSMNRFSIAATTLCETADLGDGLPSMYKWILLATDEDWLTHDDLYDFNNAFLYAAGSLKQPLDYELYDRTLSYQFELLDEEIEEQG